MAGTSTRTPKARPATKSPVALKAKLPSKTVARAPMVREKAKKAEAEPQAAASPALSAEERQRLIAQAAYFRAEKRGFVAGYELQDWLEAEAEVRRLIGSA